MKEKPTPLLEPLSDQTPTFIDLFAGCGGLSLGLMQAGWRGLFAVEKDALAFSTLKHNLIDGHCRHKYEWPAEITAEPHEIGEFIDAYKDRLLKLRGKVSLIAGGPPCQGFSLAGRRNENDPRNQLFKRYLNFVGLVKPSFLLLENVRGISVEFGKKVREKNQPDDVEVPRPFSEIIAEHLTKLGYTVSAQVIKAADFGVPQWRPRFIMVGIRTDLVDQLTYGDPFEELYNLRAGFLKAKHLPVRRPVSCSEAISDLVTVGKQRKECVDSVGFEQIVYRGPETNYQRLMRSGMRKLEEPNSLRLANHRPDTVARWKLILKHCRQGVQLSPSDRRQFGIKKQCIVPLHPNLPSHTLTTLPDDILHYSEPRILTVREYARLQSFPDWYAFCGKYTTGGDRRVREAPRYSQVGNAVAPLLAEALGHTLFRYARCLKLGTGHAVPTKVERECTNAAR